jgi:hypothetical protein
MDLGLEERVVCWIRVWCVRFGVCLACVGLLGLEVGLSFGAHFLKLGFEEGLRWTRETRVWHLGFGQLEVSSSWIWRRLGT